jgi:O-antigen ligase
MMVGFLVSNVALSISTFFFCINAMWGVSTSRWFRNKWWVLGMVWLAFIALSWFWSDDKAHWERTLQVKLPLLVFPLAFGFWQGFTAHRLRWVSLAMGLILLAGVGYSISFLIIDPNKYILQYRYSHLLPTPCSQDHVRFSMALALYIIWGIYIWPWLQHKSFKWAVGIIIVIFAVYLHVLAAKSGLVAFYLFLLCWSVYLSFARKKMLGLAILVAIPVFVTLAMKFIPTFSERKDYIWYAAMMLMDGDRSGNYGDIGRLMSYKISIRIIKEHPLTGVGAGDVMTEMKKGYDILYPQVEDKARLIPHNQFLIEGMSCGIPAMLVFFAWVCYPLTWIRRNRQSFFFFAVWLLLLTQLMIEPILEVQFGVFVYMFFLLWQRQPMPQLSATADKPTTPQ